MKFTTVWTVLWCVLLIVNTFTVLVTCKPFQRNVPEPDKPDASIDPVVVMAAPNRLQSRMDSIQPRSSITAFVTDPALLVTILHSLEVAYWTLPFGFIMKPIINLFRMPNRRSDDLAVQDVRLNNLYNKFLQSIHKLETIQKRSSPSTIQTQ